MTEYIDRNLCEIVAEYDQYYKLVVPLEKIRKMPAADVVEVRRGRWIRDKWPSGAHKVICSECREWSCKQSKYCPNCGARMGKEDET